MRFQTKKIHWVALLVSSTVALGTVGYVGREEYKRRHRELVFTPSLMVQANGTLRYELEMAPSCVYPGRLHGSWVSSGILKEFVLLSPENHELQKSGPAVEAPFEARVSGPGRFAFVFENTMPDPAGPRQITLTAKYLPD